MEKVKKFIFVCCGAGKLTSFMAAEGIREGFKKRGIKDVEIRHGMIGEVPRYEDKIDVLVCSTNYTARHKFPVLNGLPFVIQDEAGKERLIEELAGILTKLKEN